MALFSLPTWLRMPVSIDQLARQVASQVRGSVNMDVSHLLTVSRHEARGFIRGRMVMTLAPTVEKMAADQGLDLQQVRDLFDQSSELLTNLILEDARRERALQVAA